ncbi:MAG: NUDIX domain-containing protein [Candidatus Daviesbacteria bacterium]
MKSKWLPKEEFDYIYSKVPRLCVDLAVVTSQGILLTKRSITPYKGMWHTPGGTVLKKELLTDTVKRVALDEIGVNVKIRKILGIMEILREGESEKHTVSVYFLVTTLSNNFKNSQQSDKIKFFPALPKNMVPHQKKFLTEYLSL